VKIASTAKKIAQFRLQKPAGLEPIADKVLRLLLNTCWSWRMDGPLVKEYQKQWLT
jgi:hypothetical protein